MQSSQKAVVKLISLHFFLFLLFALIAYRKILTGDGVAGHNWDWTVPYFREQLLELIKYSKYLWYEYALGSSASVAQTSSIVYLMLWLAGYMGFSGVFVTKTLFVAVSLFSSIFFYLFISYFIKSYFKARVSHSIYWAAFISAFYYGFSPYLFNELNGGAISKLFSYPLVPLFMLSSIYYIKNRNYISYTWLSSSILLVLVSAAFQNLVLASIFFGIFVLYIAISEKSLVPVYKSVLIYILFLLLSTFWILPLLSTFNYAITEYVEKELFNESSLVNNIPHWYEIIVGAGYFREFFSFSSSTFLRPYIFLFGFILFSVPIYSLYIVKSTSKRLYFSLLYFFFFYLLAIIPAVSGRPPFGQYVIYLYKHFGFLNLFRSPQHFIFQVTLLFSVLLSMGTYILYDLYDKKKQRLLISILFLTLFIFLNGVFIRGDLASSHFKTFRVAGNHIDFFKYPDVYRDLIMEVSQDKSSTNTIFIPFGYSPYYLQTSYQYYGQGGDPLLLSFPKPYIANTSIRSASGLQLIEKLEDQINTLGINDITNKYLRMVGAKYIVLRQDVIVNFGNYSLLDTYDFVKKSLDNIHIGKQFDKLTLYELTPSPRIYATGSYKEVTNSFSSTVNFDDVLELKDTATLVQRNDYTSYIDTPVYILPPFTSNDDLFFEIKISGNYFIELSSKHKIDNNASLTISQVSCDKSSSFGYTPKELRVSDLLESGVNLDIGCYLINISNINKFPVYSKNGVIYPTASDSLNLDYALSIVDFPQNQVIHSYYVKFKLNSKIADEDILLWTKICGNPKTYVISNDFDTCIYDLLPLKRKQAKDSYAASFNISGNRIYSSKGLGFRNSTDISISDLELYEIKNPIVALRLGPTPEITNQPNLEVSFSRVNPTKYVIKLPNNLQDKFLLYFGQNYDDGWTLKPATNDYIFKDKIYNYADYNVNEYMSYCKDCFWPINSANSVGIHVKSDAFANGWIIDPSSPNYSNILVLEFIPQQFYILGLYISLLVIVGMSGIIYFYRRKNI